jgi:lactate permease
VFGFALLSAPGTAIFLAGALSTVFLPNLGIRKAAACLGRTVRSLRFTILTVCLVLATAYVMNYSGMSSSLGLALAATGVLFPLFSPLLGWVGVLLTGSDTSSNALFCSLQRTTAEQLGLDPGLMVAANTSGGVAGKMISPQSISVATASTGLAGQEGWLFRFTIGHSIAMALIVSAITLVQAFLLLGMIPR